MITSLPKPSVPTLPSPAGSLPSLSITKTRKDSLDAATSSDPKPLSTASPTSSAPGSRNGSVSSLPTRSQIRQPSSPNPSTASNATTPSVANTQTKPARKIINIGSFPQPPKVSRSGSYPSSPLSTSPAIPTPSPTEPKANTIPRQIPPRKSSAVGKRSPRTSTSSSIKAPRYSSSLLNGSSENKSISSGILHSLDSAAKSPTSRSLSTSPVGTIFEDNEDDYAVERRSTSVSRASSSKRTSKESKGNVVVSVRVRPDPSGNDSNRAEGEWLVDGRSALVAYKGREGGNHYYDNVFTSHDDNSRVYDSAAKRLVRRVMEGYHGTVFAYGMTGTGKTFSMQGTASSPGVIPMAITDIFSFIRETPQREFLLRVSYLEIYNEKIYDLLSPPSSAAGPNGQPAQQEEIKLREDSKRGVYATPLKEEIVQSPTQLLRVIARGDNVRRTASTQYNLRSSRSHAVVQIVVESRERMPGIGAMSENKRSAGIHGGVRVSTLSLIDLAGSEKAAETKERRLEGAHINKSLLTFGTIVARLSGDQEKTGGAAEKEKHLPYRDSKLTRLLQPALSGNSLVSILCTIQVGSVGSAATAMGHTAETLNTLKFASRAKNNIVSHAKKAEESYGNGVDAGSKALLDRYRVEIQELRKQLENQSKAKAVEAIVEDEKTRELEAEQRHEEQMLEMQIARTALKERVDHLNRLILSSKSIGVNTQRTSSSAGVHGGRSSMASNGDWQSKSARSSASQTTLEAPLGGLRRTTSATSTSSLLAGSANGERSSLLSARKALREEDAAEDEEEEDSMGENGDGTASAQTQIRVLQADLADKNRYISTLEKRLLQARRSSHSRVSMAITSPSAFSSVATAEEGGMFEAMLQEKDDEIVELRARLEDKEKMVTALRSAARKRDVADLSFESPSSSASIRLNSMTGPTRLSAGTSRESGASCDSRRSGNRRSNGSSASASMLPGAATITAAAVATPAAATSTSASTNTVMVPQSHSQSQSQVHLQSQVQSQQLLTAEQRVKGVDDMTRILDEMIQGRDGMGDQHGNAPAPAPGLAPAAVKAGQSSLKLSSDV